MIHAEIVYVYKIISGIGNHCASRIRLNSCVISINVPFAVAKAGAEEVWRRRSFFVRPVNGRVYWPAFALVLAASSAFAAASSAARTASATRAFAEEIPAASSPTILARTIPRASVTMSVGVELME